MKKALVLLCMLAMLIVGSDVFAGSIDYLSNQSARYLMTFNRNAATDAADIVNYNPAGTAFLAKGLWLDFSTQTLFKPYSQDTTLVNTASATFNRNETQEQSEPTPVLPNLYAVYNFGQMGAGNLAVNFQAGIVAGGGTLKWDNGTAGTAFAMTNITLGINNGATFGTIKSQSMEVSSVYYGLALGASYSLLDNMVAVNLGGRAVMPKRSLKLDGEYANLSGAIAVEYEYEATGYTPIIGVCVKPMDGLTIGLRYEFETELEFEYEQKKATASSSVGAATVGLQTALNTLLTSAGLTDGTKFNNNLPAILAGGVEYVVMPGLTVMAQGIYYFMKDNDLNGAEEYYNNGWEFSVGAAYQVMPELKVGAGFNYTSQSAKSELFNSASTVLTTSANPALDSYTIGLGGTYTIASLGLDITLAGSWTHYIPEDYSFAYPASFTTVSGKYEKDVYNIGFGIGYRL